MVNLGIDGLASGLNTTSLINQLMQVEAVPQTLLKQKSSTAQTLVTALQGLNTRVQSLADAAKAVAKPQTWDAFTATSSASSASVSTSGTAQPGSVSFRVTQVATSQQSVTAAVPDDGSLVPDYPPTLTVRGADGALVTVQPTSGNLADVARALNSAADAGVRATVVRVSHGTDGGEPLYRLQLTGTRTGADAGFEVFAGSADDVTAGTATRLDTALVRPPADAEITLWADNADLATTVRQASNTFTNLMTGVDVTISAVTRPDEDPVTVTVGRDEVAVAKSVSGLVSAMGVVLSEIASRTRTTTTAQPDGSTRVTGGLLSGDSTVRSLRDRVTTSLSMPVDGRSPSEVGIVIGRDGTFTFDEKRFADALTADPAGTQAMVTAIADRVATTASSFSDRFDGTLTRKIQGAERQVKDFGQQIDSWDRRLELRRASLQRQWSSLEVTLSNLQGQSSWLAGQLAGLQTNWQQK